MNRGAALLLSIGLAAAAFLYGGVWEYGDGFIFNRFNGEVIYVELPEAEEAVRLARPSAGATVAPAVRVASRLVTRPRPVHVGDRPTATAIAARAR